MGSKLPLARSPPVKIQDFVIFLLTQQFFKYSYPQYLRNCDSKAY